MYLDESRIIYCTNDFQWIISVTSEYTHGFTPPPVEGILERLLSLVITTGSNIMGKLTVNISSSLDTNNDRKLHKKTTVSFGSKSYFLNDKSNLIETTLITKIDDLISVYGSVSYFDKKSLDEIVKIISFENPLKFSVAKKYNKKDPRISALED